LLDAVTPLARRIDFGVSLDCRYNRAGRHVHFTSLLDDALKRSPDIPLAFWEPPGVLAEAARIRLGWRD
jgi:hypothetical protein